MRIGSIVKFHSLGGDLLEGRQGQIVGVGMRSFPGVDFWIVHVFDPPEHMEGTHLVMTGACLKEVVIRAS